MKFRFPPTFSELIGRGFESDYYTVSRANPYQQLDERIKKNKVREFSEAFNIDNDIITERFDFLYYYVSDLQQKYDQQAHYTLLDTLQSHLQRLKINERECAYQMTLFLLLNVLQLAPKKSQQPQINPTASKDKNNSGSTIMKRTLKTLNQISLDPVVISKLSRETSHYFFDLINQLTEVRENENRDQLVSLIFRSIVVWNDNLQYMKTLISNLIYENEQVPGPISQLFQKCYTSESSPAKAFVNDTIQLLVHYVSNQKQGSSIESLGSRNLRDILCQTSKMIPKYFYTNLSNFILLYESENYHLRNALTDILTNLVEYLTLQVQELEEHDNQNAPNAKNKLLDTLLERQNDKVAFARQAVLNSFSYLLKKNVIPAEYFNQVFNMTTARIKDVSGWVRKAALQALKQLLKCYRFVYVESQSRENFQSMEEVVNLIEENDLEIRKVQEVFAKLINKFELKQEEKNNENNNDNEQEMKLEEQPVKIEDLRDDIISMKGRIDMLLQKQVYLEDYKRFLEKLSNIITPVCILMSSRLQQDVLKSIKVASYMVKYKLPGHEKGQSKLLTLIWGQDKSTKAELLKQFWKLYIKGHNKKVIAANLIQLYSTAGLKEEASVTEILKSYFDEQNAQQYKMPKNLQNTIWSYVDDDMEPQALITHLKISKVFFQQDSAHITSEVVETLLTILKKTDDFSLIKEICQIFLHTTELNIIKCIKSSLYRLYSHFGTDDTRWFQACEELINLISRTKKPENFYEFFIKRMSEKLLKVEKSRIRLALSPSQGGSPMNGSPAETENEMEVEELSQEPSDEARSTQIKYAQIVFTAGHIAMKILTIMDILEHQLKFIKQEQKKTPHKNENELDKISGGHEAEFDRSIELLHQIVEKCISKIIIIEIIQNNMLSHVVPIIMSVIKQVLNGKGSRRKRRVRVENNQEQPQFENPLIEKMCILTFCKFMCVSETFCKNNLQLLFDLLQSDRVDYSIKNNIIISVGDLLHRFPNTVQQYHKQIYGNLYDKNPSVKKITLLVLTHLILNDMIKSKVSLSHIPRLLNDPDPNIPSMARFFLQELTKKDPRGIVNSTPDLLQNLGENYEIIVPQIVTFLDKSNADALLDRLFSLEHLEIRSIALCISLLQLPVNSFKRILDRWEHIRTKFEDQYVQDQFKNLLKKVQAKINNQARRPSNLNPELKNLLEELENKIDNFQYETFDGKRRLPEKGKRSKKTQASQAMQEEKKSQHQQQQPQSQQQPAKMKQKITKNKKKKVIQIESDDDLPYEIDEISI